MTRKMATVGFSYLLGLFIASFFIFKLSIILGIIVTLIGISLCVFLKQFNKLAYGVALATIGVALTVYGLYTSLIYNNVINKYANNQVPTKAVVKDIYIESDNSVKYLCKTKNLDTDFKFILYADDLLLDYEDEIYAKLNYKEYANNTYFQSKNYYKSKNIFLYATVDELISSKHNKNVLYYIKTYSDYVSDKITYILGGDTGAVLNAMFTGDRTFYSSSLQTKMYRCGIGHILAISGFHFSVLCGLLMMFLKNRNKYIKTTVLLLFCALFCIFTGCSVSSLRASVMLTIVYIGKLFNRKSDTLNSLGIAAFVLTLFSPYSIRDVSLLLSLSGTFGLAVVGEYVNKEIDKHRKGKLSTIREAFVSSICAGLCAAPICLLSFNGISFIGPFLLVLITPFCTVAMYCAFVYALLGCIAILKPILIIAGYAIKVVLFIVNYASQLKWIYVDVIDEYFYIWLIVTVIFVFIIFSVTKNLKKTLNFVLICFCVLSTLCLVRKFTDDTKFKVALLSDGIQGSVILYNGNNADIIVTSDNKYNAGNISDFLEQNQITNINTLTFTSFEPAFYPLYREIYSIYNIDYVIMPSDDLELLKSSDIFSTIKTIPLESIEKIDEACYNISVLSDGFEITADNFSMYCGNNPNKEYDILLLSSRKIPRYTSRYMTANFTDVKFDNILNLYRSDMFILTVNIRGEITKRSYGYAFYG